MSLAIFNLNDVGIQLAIDGSLVRTSPGYAVLDKDRLLVGEAASEKSRLLPGWTNNRFWSQLDVKPLTRSTDQVRHHADLALAHLEDIWLPVKKDVTEAIFVVPGYYDREDLGLLLGICRECDLPIRGLVDASVIQACDLPLGKTVLHLDIHLHSITLTSISNDGLLVRREVKQIIGSGFSTLLDRWANIIAEQFIQTTRFDPMHKADTEQQLFNRLPAWIASLEGKGIHRFTLAPDKAEQSITLTHDSLLKACASIYPQLVQAVRNEMSPGKTASLLVSHHFKGFPGLLDSLGLIKNIDLVSLTEMKAVGSASAHGDEMLGSEDAVQHILQISSRGETKGSGQKAATQPHATHLLWQHQAWPVGSGIRLGEDMSAGPGDASDPVCTLYKRDQELVLECRKPDAVKLNGAKPGLAETVGPGDQLEISGEMLTLIEVAD